MLQEILEELDIERFCHHCQTYVPVEDVITFECEHCGLVKCWQCDMEDRECPDEDEMSYV